MTLDVKKATNVAQETQLKLKDLREKFVIHQAASQFFSSIELRLIHKRSDYKAVLLSGDAGSGKKSILSWLLRRHNRFHSSELNVTVLPVVTIELPLVLSEKSLAENLFNAIQEDPRSDRRDQHAINLEQVAQFWRSFGVRFLVIVDFSDILSEMRSRQLLLWKIIQKFKTLCGIDLILFWDSSSSEITKIDNIIRKDCFEVDLKPLVLDALRGFLYRVEAELCCPGIHIHTDLLWRITGGRIGDVMRRIKYAVAIASLANRHFIRADDLEAPARSINAWIRPSGNDCHD